jgi:hypothetical protein
LLKHKTSGVVFLLLDGPKAQCRSPLLLQAAVENNAVIIRLPSARLIGFAWNKAACMGVDISTFESTGIFPLPEYFFSISDTGGSVGYFLWKQHLQIWL